MTTKMAASGNLALCATILVILNFRNATSFIVKPVDTLVLAGDSTQLNCTYKVAPAVSRKLWYHRNVLIAEEKDVKDPYKGHYEVVGEGDVYNLRIHNTASVDEGEYKCADFGNLSRTAEAVLYVIEHDPECEVQPNKTVKDGEDVVLTCTIELDVNAPGDLVWLKDGEEVSRMGGQSNTWETQFDRSDHSAIFDCQLQHYTLPPFKWSEISCEDKIRADVQYLSEFNMAVTPNTTVEEGERFTINCTTLDGNPGPYNMTLSHDEEIVISNDGFDIHYNISSISKSESGFYKCGANTKFYDGSDEHWSKEEQILVYNPVAFIESSTTVEALLGDVVDLVCTVDGFPTPTVMWFDSEDDVISGSEENKNITTNITTVIDGVATVTSTLTVSVVDKSYYGIYTCEASNGIPPSVKQQIHIIEPGGSNTIVIAVTVSSGSVVIIIVIIVVVYCCKRSSKKRQTSGNASESAGNSAASNALKANMESADRQEPEGSSYDHAINRYQSADETSKPTESKPETVAVYAISSKQKHGQKVDRDVLTVNPYQSPEATYAVSAKQKKTSAKKSASDAEQSKTGEGHPDQAALYAVSSKQKHSRKLDGDVVTVHHDQTPEATYSVSAKQKKSRAKKSADDVQQSKTDEDHPDPAALYAESSKKKHKRKKKDKSKGHITYADLDLPNTGSEQLKRMPAEEMIQYASIQMPEK